jgi:hypothetical protein
MTIIGQRAAMSTSDTDDYDISTRPTPPELLAFYTRPWPLPPEEIARLDQVLREAIVSGALIFESGAPQAARLIEVMFGERTPSAAAVASALAGMETVADERLVGPGFEHQRPRFRANVAAMIEAYHATPANPLRLLLDVGGDDSPPEGYDSEGPGGDGRAEPPAEGPGKVALPARGHRVAEAPAKFGTDALSLFADPHSQAVVRGFWIVGNGQPEVWQRPKGGPPFYFDPQTKVTVYVSPTGAGEQLSEADADRAWKQILSLDDDQVSTFIICMGTWLANGGGTSGHLVSARIHATDILAFRGVKKHVKGGYRPEQKQEVRDDILQLNNVWVKSHLTVWEQIGHKRKQKPVTVQSRLFEVAIESDRNLWGEETPYAFRIRPGEWALPYLSDPNRQTALLLKPIMQFDPRQGVGRMAMRLGIYLTMQWRIRAGHGNMLQPWTVETLLNGACVPVPTDSKLYTRFRDQVEDALDKLQKSSVITGWEYQRWDADAPARGWFKPWLRWTVVIAPPSAITDHYKDIPGERRRALAAAKAGAERASRPAAVSKS